MKTLWRLKSYGLRYKWRLAGAYVCTAAALAFALVIPRLVGSAIDEVIGGGGRAEQIGLAAGIVLVSVLRGGFGFGQNYLSETIAQRSAFDLRNEIFGKILSLGFGFYDRERTGDLMSKATTDVVNVQFFLSIGLIRILLMILLMAGIAGVMLASNWRLGLVVLAFIALFMWRASSMFPKMQGIWKKVQDLTGDMTAVLQENIVGMRVVRAFGAHDYEESKYEAKVSSVARQVYEWAKVWGTYDPIFLFISTAAIGIVLWLGGREIAAGRLTPGELVTFLMYMGLLEIPIWFGLNQIHQLPRVVASGERVTEVLDARSPVRERPGARTVPRAKGHIRFDGRLAQLRLQGEEPSRHRL